MSSMASPTLRAAEQYRAQIGAAVRAMEQHRERMGAALRAVEQYREQFAVVARVAEQQRVQIGDVLRNLEEPTRQMAIAMRGLDQNRIGSVVEAANKQMGLAMAPTFAKDMQRIVDIVSERMAGLRAAQVDFDFAELLRRSLEAQEALRAERDAPPPEELRPALREGEPDFTAAGAQWRIDLYLNVLQTVITILMFALMLETRLQENDDMKEAFEGIEAQLTGIRRALEESDEADEEVSGIVDDLSEVLGMDVTKEGPP